MLASKSFHRLTRKGKVLKVVKEHYLRDDIPCGLAGCSVCLGGSADGAASDEAGLGGAAASSQAAATWLSPEPFRGKFVILDTNIILQQIDVLAAASKVLCDVILLQTVMDEVRHRNLTLYNRLVALLHEPQRRFVAFANEHHRETYVERRSGETPNDYSDRLIRAAAAWLSQHFKSHEIGVLLLTDDVENGRLARELGLEVSNMRDFAASVEAQQEGLVDLVASGGSSGAGGADDGLGADDDNGEGVEGGSRPRGGALYPEHWSQTRVTTAVKTRRAFRGTLRVNRECWFEARVNIHGVVSGKADSQRDRLTGGDDVVSVLILGHSNMNRAMEGDTVVVELLPVSQWRAPSTRLVDHVHTQGAEGEDLEERAALAAAPPSAAAAASSSGQQPGKGAVALLSALDSGAPAADTALPEEEEEQEGGAGGEGAGSSMDGAPATGAPATGAEDEDMANSSSSSSSSSNGGDDQSAPTAASLRAAAASAKARGVVPTGRVVAVIKRAWRAYCGSLEALPAQPSLSSSSSSSSSSSLLPSPAAAGAPDGGAVATPALFVPVDPRVPRIRIETRQRAALSDKRLVVAIDGWDASSRYPRGHYVRTLGRIGDKSTETEVILLEHDIAARPFSSDVIACLPPADWCITPQNSTGRVDLRAAPGVVVCSVDPPGCKDIDDALHARWLPNGNVEVGVHIADVSYFVKQGTPIDTEAAARANTTYLVERRLDMLPGLLTETLCSLKAGVDRFAFSVTWELAPCGAPAPSPFPVDATGVATTRWAILPDKTRYFKSIIHSAAALTYAAAQALLDEPVASPGSSSAPPASSSPVAAGIKLLASVARSLRADRKEAGALTLASSEVRVQLDSETHDPLEVTAYELRETNNMVEEFMLLANIWVAKRTVQAYPRYAMLRRHPSPPKAQFNALLAAAAAVGVELRVDSSKALADSLDAAAVAGNPYFNRLLRIMATRCMMQAVYFSSGEVAPTDYRHYGLAAPIYTHFTSPIRRYADVIVHRLLAAALEVEPLPHSYEERIGMKALCANMNRRHLMSQLAGRASTALHTNIFFKNRIVVETGLVMRLKANGAVVLIPRFGLEGMIILGGGSEGQTTAAAGTGGAAGAFSLTFDDAAQVLTCTPTVAAASSSSSSAASGGPSAPITLRIFDEVKVALMVEERERFQKELVYRIVQPALHLLPGEAELRAKGLAIDDRTAGGGPAIGGGKRGAGGAPAGAAAAAAGAGAAGKKRGRA